MRRNQAEKAEPKKMGRPQKSIDFKVFEGLCQLQATLVEIASALGVSEDTVERRCKEHYGVTFAEVFRQKRAGGLISLRRSQFKMAETNPAMAIWLGKQYLGQADKQETKQETTIIEALTPEQKERARAALAKRQSLQKINGIQ